VNERTGEAFEFDMRLTVVGNKLKPGQPAPEFALDHLAPGASNIQTVKLSDSRGQMRLLNVVNSMDTPVCQVETKCWEGKLSELPAGVVLYSISMDLPFALARWTGVEGVKHVALSSHRDENFGRAYGVLLKEWRLLQRAVFVIDPTDTITYAEYVPDQMKEPDYAAALAAVRKAVAR
jgi:thiol peroxidase